MNKTLKSLFYSQYRVWPFLAMLLIAIVGAGFTILLPPAPDLPHFIDHSLKFSVALLFIIAFMIKSTITLAKKTNNEVEDK